MNRHFARTDFQSDGSYLRPTRLYGSLDHLERGHHFTLAAFDCVDADWFDMQRNHPMFGGYFNGADPNVADHFWRHFWKAVKLPGCPRRSNFDPPCRLNFDPGLVAGIA